MKKLTITSKLLILCFFATIILGLNCSRENQSPVSPSARISQPKNENSVLTAVKRRVHGYVKNWGVPNEAAVVKLFVDYPPEFPDYTYYTWTNSSGYYKFEGRFEHSQAHTEYVTVLALGAQLQGDGQSGTRSPPVICPPKTYSSPSPGQPGSKFYYDPNYSGWIWRQDFYFECGGPPS